MNVVRRAVVVFAVVVSILSCSGEIAEGIPPPDLGTEEQAAYYLPSAKWPTRTIPVCWENPSSGNVSERGWVRDAIANSWEMYSMLSFTGWGQCEMVQPGIRIRISDETARSGIGTQIDGLPSGMLLNFTFNNAYTYCRNNDNRERCIRALAVHEFGHAISFRHEENRPDTPDSCADLRESAPGTSIGIWDIDSVMNTCNPQFLARSQLSGADIKAVQLLYGIRRDDFRVFDPAFYLSLYPDLRAAYGNNHAAARRHWLLGGIHEGRRGSPAFDVKWYLGLYPDLKAKYGQNYAGALDHWLNVGFPLESRRGSREFDINFYVELYESEFTKPFFEAGRWHNARALKHWLWTGLPREGRSGSAEFNVRRYLEHYADLRNAFGQDYRAALEHWIHRGLPIEGRRASVIFEVKYYLNRYPDLRSVYGTNYQSAFDHFIFSGLPREGRRGSLEYDPMYFTYPGTSMTYVETAFNWLEYFPQRGAAGSRDFDVKYYLATYPDLQAAYGTNYVAALYHWIDVGRNEGRRGAP